MNEDKYKYQISVTITNYNSEKYINQLLNSIKNQTYTDFEIVISDDCSKDESPNYIQKFINENPKLNINFIKQKENIGLIENRNVVLNAALGKYITFVDCDDYLEINCLEELINVANQDDKDYVIGQFKDVDDNGKVLQIQDFPNTTSKWVRNPHHACLYKRSIFVDNNIYFKNVTTLDDVYINVIFSLYAKNIGFVYKPLYNWRIGHESTSNSKNNKYIKFVNDFEKLLEECNWIRERIEDEEEKLIFDYKFIMVYYLVLFHTCRYESKKNILIIYRLLKNKMKDFNSNYLNNKFLRIKSRKLVRKYVRRILFISSIIEKIHLMPISLFFYNFISKFYYFVT